MDNLNIMIVGVGGQGTLLASRLLGKVAQKQGYDVKVSEIHGMSQRGGSVVTYVKMGDKVYSPIIEKGEADFILAFEKLEALRWIDYLKKDGTLVLNDQEIDPMPVITGSAKYPEGITEKLEAAGVRIRSVNALATAMECGNIKAVNMVLIGLLAGTSSIGKEIWLESLKEVVPQKLLDVNIRAFNAGYMVR
ncbi:MAG TPA: indolepyruvate oxidoreductase subunit beta [Clostridiales bacterium]|nr:indolepyruvate oxidoreductase subunit beta [Clostridiales bacterium]HPV02435.1 indolepyruvate oxidoreductase subunit beta [Clostridiales bacterium]